MAIGNLNFPLADIFTLMKRFLKLQKTVNMIPIMILYTMLEEYNMYYNRNY